MVKSEKGCKSSHIGDGVLYQMFAGTYNALAENQDCFIGNWQERLGSDNALAGYKAKQFIGIIANAEPINEFDIELYFAIVEKMTVYEGERLVVRLPDGTAVEY